MQHEKELYFDFIGLRDLTCRNGNIGRLPPSPENFRLWLLMLVDYPSGSMFCNVAVAHRPEEIHFERFFQDATTSVGEIKSVTSGFDLLPKITGVTILKTHPLKPMGKIENLITVTRKLLDLYTGESQELTIHALQKFLLTFQPDTNLNT